MIKRLSHYVAQAKQHLFDEFAALHQFPVLVLLPAEETSSEPFNTTEVSRTKTEARPAINDDYRVSPLIKRGAGGNPFDFFITVGRSKNNDIVLRDIEVSKVHAYLAEDPQGNWTVKDASSTNGTYLNGRKITPDEKTLVRSSDTIKFGPSVSSVFFNTADFYQFLKSPEVVRAFPGL